MAFLKEREQLNIELLILEIHNSICFKDSTIKVYRKFNLNL